MFILAPGEIYTLYKKVKGECEYIHLLNDYSWCFLIAIFDKKPKFLLVILRVLVENIEYGKITKRHRGVRVSFSGK